MLCPASRFLFSFLWIFSLRRPASASLQCEPGQMLAMSMDRCVPCPDRQYQPHRGQLIRECMNCRPCGTNSKEISPCSSTRNAVCQCLQGFKSFESGRNCWCAKGKGIKTSGGGEKVCEECPDGAFSSEKDVSCLPWRKCDHSGVQTPGSSTSDVVCQHASSTESRSATPPSTASVLRPETTSTSSTLSPAWTRPGPTSPRSTPSHDPPASKPQGLWLVPLGCILLLLLIQFLIMRVRVFSCFHREKKMIRQDSACGKPVEESGEKLCSPAV